MISVYKNTFLDYLESEFKTDSDPKTLYQPISYILKLGGKRLRPIFSLMSAHTFSEDYKSALPVAMAIEIFHNFTLIHDDIMDASSLRRGKQTVHTKWDENTAILSGDAMMIMSYKYLEKTPMYTSLIPIFSKMALEVCEGQQYDMDFENMQEVDYDLYLKMISYKTAVLIATAMKMGAIVGGADNIFQENIYNFGYHLGIAFQLQDDYLDTFGDSEDFGKRIGGDILESKKTALYIKSLEKSSKSQKEKLLNIYADCEKDKSDKISEITNIFLETKANDIIRKDIESYTNKALNFLEKLPIEEDKKQLFRDLSGFLIKRTI